MANGTIYHAAAMAKAFTVSPEGQFALEVGLFVGGLIKHAAIFGLNLIPAVGLMQAVAGVDLYGHELSGWERVLYALPFLTELAEVRAVGTAIEETTADAGEAAGLLGRASRVEEELAAAELKAMPRAAGELEEFGAASQAMRYGDEGIAEASAARFADEGEGFASEAGTCANSFSADTPVATVDGEQPIGQIKIGDHVLAYD
jgi:hypothetical protein